MLCTPPQRACASTRWGPTATHRPPTTCTSLGAPRHPMNSKDAACASGRCAPGPAAFGCPPPGVQVRSGQARLPREVRRLRHVRARDTLKATRVVDSSLGLCPLELLSVFPSSCTILHSQMQHMGLSMSLHPCQHMLHVCLFDSSRPRGCNMASHCGFDSHLPITFDVLLPPLRNEDVLFLPCSPRSPFPASAPQDPLLSGTGEV